MSKVRSRELARVTVELRGALTGHEQAVRSAAVAWQRVASAEDFDAAFDVAEVLSERETSARAHVWRLWEDLDAMAARPSAWRLALARRRLVAAREWRAVKAQVREGWRPGILVAALAVVGGTWWTGSLTEGVIGLGTLALCVVAVTVIGAVYCVLTGRFR